MSLFLTNSGASLVLANGGVPRAGKTLVSLSNLTWEGQGYFAQAGSSSTSAGQTGYSYCPNTIRYVSGERRILTTLWHSTLESSGLRTGDLVEWREPVSLTTGATTGFTSSHQMREVRRWTDWTLHIEQNAVYGDGNGCHVGGLWWDETQGVVWYTLYAYYSGANLRCLGATRLNDNGTVTKYGLWHYRSADAGQTYWKQCQTWLTPIPSTYQSEFGGRTHLIGAPAMGVIGVGHVGPGCHAISLPALTDAAGTVISLGQRIVDYTPESLSGSYPAYVCNRDTNYTRLGSAHVTGGSAGTQQKTISGSTTALYTATSLGTGINDAVYFGSTDAAPTGVAVHMTAGASGGARTWEYSQGGSSWGALSVTVSVGTDNLTGTVNNVYWTPPGDWASAAVNGATCYWVRAKTTSEHSGGGTFNYAQLHESGSSLPAITSGDGKWQMTLDATNTFVWVDSPTLTCQGVLMFGRQAHGSTWYGIGDMYNGGSRYTDPCDPSTGGYGYHSDAVRSAALMAFNDAFVREVARGERAADASGMELSVVYDWSAQWPNMATCVSAEAGGTAGFKISSDIASCGSFDATTNQIIWTPPRSYLDGGSIPVPTFQLFTVS